MRTLCCCILFLVFSVVSVLTFDFPRTRRSPLGVAAGGPFKAPHARFRLQSVLSVKEVARGRRNRERNQPFSHDATGFTRPYRHLFFRRLGGSISKNVVIAQGGKFGRGKPATYKARSTDLSNRFARSSCCSGLTQPPGGVPRKAATAAPTPFTARVLVAPL